MHGGPESRSCGILINIINSLTHLQARVFLFVKVII